MLTKSETGPMFIRLIALVATLCVGAVSAAEAGGRRALVVGNSVYASIEPLENAVNDSAAIAEALRSLGFEVDERRNLTFAEFNDALVDYYRAVDEAEASVFYYAGHAISIDGLNYLLPVDFDADNPTEAKIRAMDSQLVIQTLSDTSETALLFLDSCRDNPWAKKFRSQARTRSLVQRGMALMAPRSSGTLISFSTEPGSLALDAATGEDHSPYAKALLENLMEPNLEIDEMMDRVRRRVRELTGNVQSPWNEGSLEGEFYFNYAPEAAVAAAPADAMRFEAELEAWRSAQSIGTAAAYAAFLSTFPNSAFSPLAKAAIAAQATASAAPAVAAGPDPAERELWEAARQLNTLTGYERYLERYPEGVYSDAAEVRRDIMRRDRDRAETETRRLAALAPQDGPAPSMRTLSVIEDAGEAEAAAAAARARRAEADRKAKAEEERARLAALDRDREAELEAEREAHRAAERAALARMEEVPMAELQWALKGLGLYEARVDGLPGPGTRRAMRAFQKMIDAPRTGELDNAQKFRAILMAAERGYPASQNTLGILYAAGIGAPQSAAEAARWLRQAARQGHEGARANLERLEAAR